MSYGVDILMSDDLVVGPGGDLLLARAKTTVLQDVLHRLLTMPGELWQYPGYGAGLRLYLQDGDAMEQAVQAVQDQVENDPRVDTDTVQVSAENQAETIKITTSFSLLDVPGEQNLVLVWDKETGELTNESG